MRPTHRLATICLAAAFLAIGLAGCAAEEALPEGTILTDTHSFEEVAPGVYFILGRDDVIFVQSNAMLVVTDEDALVVDSHVTPAAARALLASIAEVTDKPVTHLVNTHYHFDHAHGNQSFPEDVAIVGHEFTRAMLMTDVMDQPTAAIFTGNIPNQIAAMKEAADAMEEGEEKDQAHNAIRIQEAHYASPATSSSPAPPTSAMPTSTSGSTPSTASRSSSSTSSFPATARPSATWPRSMPSGSSWPTSGTRRPPPTNRA